MNNLNIVPAVLLSQQLLSHYAKHDSRHILLDYDTAGKGEVCLQCFMPGNGHFSLPVGITVLFGCITMPEHWGAFIKAYQKRKQSTPIEGWNWFEILHQPVHVLQHTIHTGGKQP